MLIHVCHPKGLWWAYFRGSLFRRGLSLEGISVAFKNGLGLKMKAANNTKITAQNSLKQLTLKLHGLIFGRAYYRAHFPREGLFLFYFNFIFCGGGVGGEGGGQGLIILILRHVLFSEKSFRLLDPGSPFLEVPEKFSGPENRNKNL